MFENKKLAGFVSLLVIAITILSACAPATPQVVEKEVVVEKPVAETVIVEKEVVVEKPVVQTVVVEKEVVVTATPEVKKPSGEITILWDEPFVQTDPHFHWSVLGIVVDGHVYEPLVDRDNEGNFVGLLAESWETIDDTTWEFKLRKGVKFHNGEPFNAESVRFTIDHVTAMEESQRAFMWDLFDRAEVIDDHTVRITTKEPWGGLLSALTQTYMLPPKDTAALGGQPIEKMIGTGPYKFISWTKGFEVVLEANEDWWGDVPDIKTVHFAESMDAAVRAAAAQSGDADIVVRVPVEELDNLKANPDIELHQVLSGRMMEFQFNHKQGVFADKRLREAAVRAIDRRALQQLLHDQGQVTDSVGPSACAVVKDDLDPSVYAYDPERSKQLLAEAGYPDGLKGPTFIAGTWATPDIVQAVHDQLTAAGIETDLQIIGVSPFIDARRNGTYDIMAGGITCMEGDGESVLIVDYHGERGVWWIDYPEINAMLDEATGILDQEQRKAAFFKAQEALWQEYANVFLYTMVDNTAVNKRIDGFFPRADGYVRVWEYTLKE